MSTRNIVLLVRVMWKTANRVLVKSGALTTTRTNEEHKALIASNILMYGTTLVKK